MEAESGEADTDDTFDDDYDPCGSITDPDCSFTMEGGGNRGGSRFTPSMGMTNKELCENNDMATDTTLDPYLGISTHKMNPRFRPMKARHEEWKDTIERVKLHQDFHKTYHELTSGDALQSFFLSKTKAQNASYKEHVMKYLCMFVKNSGYEIQPCHRYTMEEDVGAKISSAQKCHPWIRPSESCEQIQVAREETTKDGGAISGLDSPDNLVLGADLSSYEESSIQATSSKVTFNVETVEAGVRGKALPLEEINFIIHQCPDLVFIQGKRTIADVNKLCEQNGLMKTFLDKKWGKQFHKDRIRRLRDLYRLYGKNNDKIRQAVALSKP